MSLVAVQLYPDLHPSASANLDAVNQRIANIFLPPEDMLVSEWAERFRILPKGTTARPGPYVCESFQREIMDSACDPSVREVTFIKSTQVGGTEIMNNVIGWGMDIRPVSMMLVMIRNSDAADKSKKVIAPMIAACDRLRAKVRENKSRTGGNTQMLKFFDGDYFLKLAGANSAAGLRGDPIGRALEDEIDGWTDNADGEGPPEDLIDRRMDTFDDSLKWKTSTPARPAKFSPIFKSFQRSDQRFYYVPCPKCGKKQNLLWKNPDSGQYNLVWEHDRDGMPVPGTVRYVCIHCAARIEERLKQSMLDAGEWIPKFPDRIHHRGYSINALYSPWKPVWESMAREFAEAQRAPEKLRAFVNLRLGECFEDGEVTIEPESLESRCEDYDPEERDVQVPWGAAVLVCSVDVQHNRLEAKITAFGPEEEEWHIDHQIFWGAPGLRPGAAENEDEVNVWDELEAYRLREWKHASGAMLKPAITFVDSGAYADAVAAYVIPRQNMRNRVFASKGVDFLRTPGLVEETVGKKHKLRLFLVATYTAKDRIFTRLEKAARPQPGKPAPNYIHFPKVKVLGEGGIYHKENLPIEFFRQLTAETKIPVRDQRTHRTRLVYAMNHDRNEILDMEVYAHGARVALQTIIDPKTYGDLKALHAKVCEGGDVPRSLRPQRKYGVVSEGVY